VNDPSLPPPPVPGGVSPGPPVSPGPLVSPGHVGDPLAPGSPSAHAVGMAPSVPDPAAAGAAPGIQRWVIAGALASGGAALLVLGAFLPWVTGADAGEVVRGVRVNSTGTGLVGSRAGWAGGDGVVFVLAGMASLVVGVAVLADRRRAWYRATLLGVAGLCGAWAWVDLTSIGSVATQEGDLLALSPGAGAWLTVVGVLSVAAGGLVLPPRPVAQVVGAVRSAQRLQRRGYQLDALEVLQTALRRHGDPVLRSSPHTWLRAMSCLSVIQTDVGDGEAARRNVELMEAVVARRPWDSPEEAGVTREQVASLMSALRG